MSLTINGIDFDKRCDDAKRQLHLNIEWRATVYDLRPYFEKCHIIPERNDTSIMEWVRRKGMQIRHNNKFIPFIET